MAGSPLSRLAIPGDVTEDPASALHYGGEGSEVPTVASQLRARLYFAFGHQLGAVNHGVDVAVVSCELGRQFRVLSGERSQCWYGGDACELTFLGVGDGQGARLAEFSVTQGGDVCSVLAPAPPTLALGWTGADAELEVLADD